MSIRRQYYFDKKAQKLSGYVDLGGFTTESERLASEALVFLIVSLKDKFKCPVAYFLVDKLSAEVQSQLIETCITKLSNIGINILNVTFDGAQSNIRSIRLLGCEFFDDINNIQPSFKLNGKEIFTILDPCHMIKLARNTLSDKKLLNGPNGEIKWSYIKDLVEEQDKIGLKFANKLSSKHINYHNKKMNVSLAAQTLSSSTANALEYLLKSGHQKFQGAKATIEFIRIIDHAFDLLNSRNPFAKGIKSPLFPEKKN